MQKAPNSALGPHTDWDYAGHRPALIELYYTFKNQILISEYLLVLIRLRLWTFGHVIFLWHPSVHFSSDFKFSVFVLARLRKIELVRKVCLQSWSLHFHDFGRLFYWKVSKFSGLYMIAVVKTELMRYETLGWLTCLKAVFLPIKCTRSLQLWPK